MSTTNLLDRSRFVHVSVREHSKICSMALPRTFRSCIEVWYGGKSAGSILILEDIQANIFILATISYFRETGRSMISVKAGFFDVIAVNASSEDVTSICRGYVRKDSLEVAQEDGRYQLTDWSWDKGDGVAVGTMWKVRENNLPRGWMNGKSIPVNTPLVEGTSFAYSPSLSSAVVQYNQHGARHKLLGSFLEQIGVPQPVTVLPKVNQDELERLRHGTTIGRFTYTLGDIRHSEALRGAGVGASVDQAIEVNGLSIKVSIRLKQDKKNKADATAKAMEVIEKLMNAPGVRALKASYKPTEAHRMEILNLLGGHKSVSINVPEKGLELDHATCRNNLWLALMQRPAPTEKEQ